MPTFKTSDGLDLYYTDEGSGLAVLCLAGLTRNSSDFDYLAPYLDGARMIALDYRGRGQSAWAKDHLTYSIPVEARDVIELLNHLELDKVAIIGTSRGGLIAMALAATVKERLLGVCLNDIGPDIPEDAMADIMAYVGHNPVHGTLEAAAKARASLLPGFKNVPQERWNEEVAKHYVQTDEGLKINYDPKLKDALEAAQDQPLPDLWPLFGLMDGLPLCAIRGANSTLLTPETFARMKQLAPEMITVEVPDRGHVPFLDEVEALDALNEWMMHL